MGEGGIGGHYPPLFLKKLLKNSLRCVIMVYIALITPKCSIRKKIVKIKYLRFCVMLLVCLMMCGCSVSIDSLLTPPKLTAEQNEIYRELLNSVGSVKLKYPKSGEYRSAFVLKDIDNESGIEALVFYESKNVQPTESTLRMKILDKNDDKWEAVYDLACPGSEVESISFSSLGDNGRVDIIVCFSMFNQTEKSFVVLNYENRIPQVLFSSVYSCLEVFDLNNDGLDELISVAADKVNQVSAAMMFTNGENGFEKLSETMIFGNAANYTRVTKGKLDEKTPALFLDYTKGNGQSGTDVLYCYDNALFCPDGWGTGSNSVNISRVVNDYMAEIYSMDIDGDGFVEIPVTTPLPGYELAAKGEQLCAVMWYTVKDDMFIPDHYSYYSGKYRFALLFPNRWRGIVSAIADFTANEIAFVTYDMELGITGSANNELMRIRAVNKDDAEAVEAASGLKILGESEEAIFCLIESNSYYASTLALTESELKNSFIVL